MRPFPFPASFPASWRLSLALSAALTAIFALVSALQPTAMHWSGYLLFFACTTSLLMVVLEVVIYRKLTSLQQINQRELKKMRDLENYRRDFLGEVSHELKTPIFATQGFLHTLIDGAMDDPRVRVKFLKRALKNADRLAHLVEDLLIITRAESGEMVIRVRPFGIYDLVAEVVDMLDIKFTRKGRNIRCTIMAHGLEHAQVLADRERIQQVITNLVDNAVKYGNQQGSILLEIGKDSGKIWVSVTDDGPGIDDEHLALLFRRFYRIDKSRSRDGGGTGLGLSICKHLIEAHGEQILVHSHPGKGATFRFSLKQVEQE